MQENPITFITYMELFLVIDPPLMLIELLNFYGILSEGFLISVFGQVAVKKTDTIPFSSHKICSVSTSTLFSPTSPTCIRSKKRLQRRSKTSLSCCHTGWLQKYFNTFYYTLISMFYMNTLQVVF